MKNQIFIKVSLNNTECYVGAPIRVSYELYSSVNSVSAITRQPLLNGFMVKDLVSIVSAIGKPALVNGQKFEVYTLKKSILIPLREGELKLDPM